VFPPPTARDVERGIEFDQIPIDGGDAVLAAADFEQHVHGDDQRRIELHEARTERREGLGVPLRWQRLERVETCNAGPAEGNIAIARRVHGD